MEAGGLKRFHFDELTPAFFLRRRAGILVPYLDGISRDLALRDADAAGGADFDAE